MNYRAKKGVLADSTFQLFQVHDTISLYGKICHVKAFILKLSTRIKDTFMIDLCSYDVFPLVTIERGHAFETKVV